MCFWEWNLEIEAETFWGVAWKYKGAVDFLSESELIAELVASIVATTIYSNDTTLLGFVAKVNLAMPWRIIEIQCTSFKASCGIYCRSCIFTVAKIIAIKSYWRTARKGWEIVRIEFETTTVATATVATATVTTTTATTRIASTDITKANSKCDKIIEATIVGTNNLKGVDLLIISLTERRQIME